LKIESATSLTLGEWVGDEVTILPWPVTFTGAWPAGGFAFPFSRRSVWQALTMTMTTDIETTEAIYPHSVPAYTAPWSEPERLQAFLMLLQDFVQAGIDVRVRAEFLPATGDQQRQIKEKIKEFLLAFPDPKPTTTS
jgi:hypothetical protein